MIFDQICIAVKILVVLPYIYPCCFDLRIDSGDMPACDVAIFAFAAVDVALATFKIALRSCECSFCLFQP